MAVLRASYVVPWNTTGLSKATAISWQAGDLLAVVAGDEYARATTNFSTLPTLTDNSSQTVTFTQRQNIGTNGASCNAALWTARPVNNGTSRTLTVANVAAGDNWGWRCFVYTNADYDNSAGNDNVVMSGGAVSLSLTRNTDNCSIVEGLFDYSASADVTVTTNPAGGTQDDAISVGTSYAAFVFDWGDQGVAGTTSYGLTNGTGTGRHAIVVCSIKSMAPPTPPITDAPEKLIVTQSQRFHP